MYKAFLALLSAALLTAGLSCKKMVEDKQRDALIAAMTDGEWLVETYIDGDMDITADFSGYAFRFYEDGTVHGKTTAGLAAAGTWEGDIQNFSIKSHFRTAANPVKRLNGIWTIKNTEMDYVAAEMNLSDRKLILRLRKKP